MGHSRRRIEEQAAREIGLALVLLAVALVQTALLPRPLGIVPNLLLLLAVARGLIAGPAVAARWAFYGGVALDLCAVSPLGSHALALLAAVLASSLALLRLSRGNWLVPILGTAIGALAYHATLAAITSLVVEPVDPEAYVLAAALPDLLVAVVPALPIYMLMRWAASRSRGEVQLDVY